MFNLWFHIFIGEVEIESSGTPNRRSVFFEQYEMQVTFTIFDLPYQTVLSKYNPIDTVC